MFIKKELLQIPVEPCKKKIDKYFVTGKMQESYIVLTVYDKDNQPFIRIFIDKEINHIIYDFKTKTFSYKRLTSFGKYSWCNLTSYQECETDDKTAKLVNKFLNCCKGNNILNEIDNKIYAKNQSIFYKNRKNKIIECDEAFKKTKIYITSAKKHFNTIKYIGCVDKSNRISECFCQNCKNDFSIFTPRYPGSTLTCSECGQELKVINLTRTRRKTVNKFYTEITEQNKNALAVVYLCETSCNVPRKERDKPYKFEFSDKVSAVERYLFTPDGNFGQIKAYKNNGQNICQFEKWRYKDEIKDRFGSYFPVKIFDINNTVLKNCKIEEFKDRFARTANVIKYLDTYTKYPCVENLLMNGFFELVNEKCGGSKILNETCDFKKFKIKDILGLNKEEIDRCRIARWSGEKIADYKVCKKEFAKTPTEIQLIAYREIKRADCIKTKDKKSLFKFMEYQLKKQEIASCNILSIWQDYINISKKNGDDLSKEYLLYPKKLKERHNEAVKRAKFKEKEEFKIMFKELADAYKPLSFVKGNYCIRIAKNENELIQEGKILEHCVGGYGGNHCAGRCIFFVRLANEPNQPLYTLQIDVKKGEQIQLHGANNEMHGQKIPQEVQTFINYWLKNIFLKYDMTEKKLINKRHTNKVA